MPVESTIGGQHLHRHAERRARLGGPRRAVGGQQTGDRGVGRVGDVDGAARQHPRDPRVDRAEAQVAIARAGDVVEQPGDLGRRLVGGERQSVLGLGGDAVEHRAQVLPTEAGPDRLARRCDPTPASTRVDW